MIDCDGKAVAKIVTVLRTENIFVCCCGVGSDRVAGVSVSLGTLDLVRVDGRPCLGRCSHTLANRVLGITETTKTPGKIVGNSGLAAGSAVDQMRRWPKCRTASRPRLALAAVALPSDVRSGCGKFIIEKCLGNVQPGQSNRKNNRFDPGSENVNTGTQGLV